MIFCFIMLTFLSRIFDLTSMTFLSHSYILSHSYDFLSQNLLLLSRLSFPFILFFSGGNGLHRKGLTKNFYDYILNEQIIY